MNLSSLKLHTILIIFSCLIFAKVLLSLLNLLISTYLKISLWDKWQKNIIRKQLTTDYDLWKKDNRGRIINNLSKDNLIKSSFGVWEPNPDSCELISSESIDTILVPGLGFTQSGERLGRGGGFYDKFLATCKSRTKLIGICFKVQIIDILPREKHDHLVTNIITA